HATGNFFTPALVLLSMVVSTVLLVLKSVKGAAVASSVGLTVCVSSYLAQYLDEPRTVSIASSLAAALAVGVVLYFAHRIRAEDVLTKCGVSRRVSQALALVKAEACVPGLVLAMILVLVHFASYLGGETASVLALALSGILVSAFAEPKL